jgi:hypothetical protein
MYTLCSNIEIGNLQFDYVHHCAVDSSWKNLTSTAEIMLPKNLKLAGDKLNNIIKKGQAVKIQCGYDGALNTEFNGFVTGLKPGIPFKIMCEDEMWNLKQTNVKLHYSHVTLKKLLADIMPSNIQYTAIDAELGPVNTRFGGASIAMLLEEIEKQYGIRSFFQNGILNVGFAYPAQPEVVYYDFEKNIIEDDLEFRSKEDDKIRVKAISILPDKRKITVHVGDVSGAIRTLTYYNISKKQLEINAKKEIDRLKVDGWRGSLTSFGIPFAQHGMAVDLTDNDLPERSGQYFIDRHQVRFGVEGYRRILHLGPKSL